MADTKRPDVLRALIDRYQVYIDPMVDVFHVELKSHQATWNESFGSEGELRAFLKGVQAGSGMTGGPIFTPPEIPVNPSKRFDEAKNENSDDDIPF